MQRSGRGGAGAGRPRERIGADTARSCTRRARADKPVCGSLIRSGRCGRGHRGGRFSTGPTAATGWSWTPRECDLDPFTAERLLRLLARETDPKQRCLSGQWEGGSSHWDTDVLLVPRGWNYFVRRASFRNIAEWPQQPYSFGRHLHGPHVVWPADRRWLLATLYSGQSNHLAGSRALIDKVLESELESYEVALTDEAR